ncbi:glycosyltransferase family 4 protein [Methanosphaera sp.]|uniref:glycosyltransferase family 4 protein n=1 Tax=Methanosphaera sp. TaxID=2666342 RepID=UPI0025E990D0|nr:glycosyltransferase family 4 protein [Methanosphaera sp.]
MNICIVTEYFPHSDCLDIKGGVEVCCYNEALGLSKYHNVTVLTSKEGELDEFNIQDVHVICCGEDRGYVQKGSFTSRLKFMKDAVDKHKDLEDIDLVIGYNFITYPVAYKLAEKLNSKVALRYHDVWIGEWTKNMGISGLFGEILERYIFKKDIDLYVAVSDFTRNNLNKYVDNTKTITVHNIVDFPMVESEKYDKPTISCVARLVEYKRVNDLIKAVALIKDEIPEIQCKIIGTGPEDENLKNLTKQLELDENIEFLGFVEEHDDVMKVVNSSDVFCLPSIVEGFGIVIIEAQSLETPFVAARIPPVVESSGQKGGLFFEPKNHEELAKQILTILNDRELYKKLQIEGLENKNNYTKEVIGDKLNKAYESLFN